MEVLIGIALALGVGLVAVIIWLARARKKQVQAEADVVRLVESERRRTLGDRVMSEPTAFEPRWLRAARERLRERDR